MGIFIVQYDGYYFDPCSGDICLAIDGYNVAPQTIFCDSIECVEETLNKNGITHLNGVYEMIYFDRYPWTSDADGRGASLQRVDEKRSANDPTNWQKSRFATPGRPPVLFNATHVQCWMLY